MSKFHTSLDIVRRIIARATLTKVSLAKSLLIARNHSMAFFKDIIMTYLLPGQLCGPREKGWDA
jgi:hypothetical protein